jgi:hypothetical protein
MSLELLNTLATLGTFLVITATAIAAVVQLRHMRGSNQISALNEIFAKRQTPEMEASAHFVFTQLPEKIKDPAFRYQLTHEAARTAENAAGIDKIFVVGSFYEEVGVLVKAGLVDRDLLCDMHGLRVVAAWDALVDVTAVLRGSSALLGENFEYLTVVAQDWIAKHPSGAYPAGVRRLDIPHKWRSDDERYAATLAKRVQT